MVSTQRHQSKGTRQARERSRVYEPLAAAQGDTPDIGAFPFRFDLRIASADEIDRANIERARQGQSLYEPAEQALAEIEQNTEALSGAQITAWLSHPDERVAVAAGERLTRAHQAGGGGQRYRAEIKAYADRACLEAARDGLLWTGFLDAVANQWDNPDVRALMNIMPQLAPFRLGVRDWVRAHGDPRTIEVLLRFSNRVFRYGVVGAARAIDAPLAARLMLEADVSVLVNQRLMVARDVGISATALKEELRLLRHFAVEQLRRLADPHVTSRGSGAQPIELVGMLDEFADNGSVLTAAEIDTLIACLPGLARGEREEPLLWLVGLIARSTAVTPAQLVELYRRRPELPRRKTGARAALDSLLGHERAPVDFVRSIVVGARDRRWRHLARIVVEHQTAVVDPVIRARLCRSRDAHVLARLCETAQPAELARLLPRVLRRMSADDREVEHIVMTLLEREPERANWVRHEELAPLLDSPVATIRERAMLLLGII